MAYFSMLIYQRVSGSHIYIYIYIYISYIPINPLKFHRVAVAACGGCFVTRPAWPAWPASASLNEASASFRRANWTFGWGKSMKIWGFNGKIGGFYELRIKLINDKDR